MRVEDRVDALRQKRLAGGSFVLASLNEDDKDPDSSPRVRPRRLRHCDKTMRHLWQGTDYRCEQCGLVVEVYDDLIIDGYTSQPVLMDSSFIGATRYTGTGRTVPKHSMKQKAAMVEEAKANGLRATARQHGISPSTLQNYVRQTAAL